VDSETTSIWALRDVSTSIEQGEVVGILGRNGAGKSTLLKILSRITYPTHGKVKVKGRVASLLEVGTGFHEELTGRENVFLNGSILGMSRKEIQSKLDEIIAFSGVEKFIDTPIKRYSSGMRLRLGFAVAAHLDPDVLIIDEVLAVGDAGFQKKCLNVMEDMHHGGRTVLFVSHNIAAIDNLCTRAIWIDSGRVVMDGPARGVVQSYMASFNIVEDAAADLSGCESRRGTGNIRYTSFVFLSVEGVPQKLIRSGDSLVMRFHYHAELPIYRPSFGFQLFTELGTLITETSTWHHGIEIPRIPAGSGHLDLQIDMLNLLPGRYRMSLCLTGPNGTIHDWLEKAICLEVEVASIYRSSRTIDSRYGIVYFPQTWRIEGISAEVVGHIEADSVDRMV
jgi:lipopolysaccharide transport system ATP-binding protein